MLRSTVPYHSQDQPERTRNVWGGSHANKLAGPVLHCFQMKLTDAVLFGGDAKSIEDTSSSTLAAPKISGLADIDLIALLTCRLMRTCILIINAGAGLSLP